MNQFLKHWGCLNKPIVAKGEPKEKLEKQKKYFYACCVMQQVSMQMGYKTLWDVDNELFTYK